MINVREKGKISINIDNHLVFSQGLCITDSIKNVFIIFLYPENLQMVLHVMFASLISQILQKIGYETAILFMQI